VVTEKQVWEKLQSIPLPGTPRDIVAMNYVRQVNIDPEIMVTLAATGLLADEQKRLQQKVVASIETLNGAAPVHINFVEVKPLELNSIDSIVATMSGKGGVGKSLVAALAAVSLRREGFSVGILDADIAGPSIPRMFGATAHPVGSGTGILPVFSRLGIEIMSMNLLLSQENEAVIWRGPLVSRAINQFWEDVVWGRLDYLIIDMPPGTTDAALTVMQSLPVSGVIMVTTPQNLTAMMVKKAVSMVRKMNIPLLGLIENMSYYRDPETGQPISIFGPSRGEALARETEVPFAGRLSLDPELARQADNGGIEDFKSEDEAAFHHKLLQILPEQTSQI
jgi:Mrp family chromosome partitioning ATPase